MSYGIENQDEQGTNYNEAWNQFQGPLNWAIGMVGQRHREDRALRNEMDLMSLAHQYQLALNQQGHDLQFEMWKKTNFPAQLAMMKEAGLSPGLMYKQGGPGGTTGSQTGGQAQKGKAPAPQPMDMQNLLLGKQAQLLDSQAKNTEADTKLKNEEAKFLGDSKTRLTEASIKEIIQNTTNKSLEAKLIKLETDLKEIRRSTYKRELEANIDKTEAELRRISIAGDLDEATFNASVREAVANSFKAQAENRLFDSKVYLTDAQTNQIYNSIQQEWAKIDIAEGQLDETERRNTIAEFELDLREKLTQMNIDADLKIEILRSLTSVFTTFISGISNIRASGTDRRIFNYRTDF